MTTENVFEYPEYSHINSMYVLTEGLPSSHPLSVKGRYIAKYGTTDGLPVKYMIESINDHSSF